MATSQLRRVVQTLRWTTLPQAGLTDGQLLTRYIHGREEAAFAALVQRHGPMVWGVCLRVLRSHQDAEDAFQATFLVLVRKAASIAQRDKVANWLYGVAHQTALKARATTAKRRAREKLVTVIPEPAFEPRELWDDLQPLLDQELSRLPDKYRAVIVLCDLEGKTRKEASQHFHLPEGTVATRLATARAMLARRLARPGLRFSGGVLATLLAEHVASARVPTSVALSTIRAASFFAAGPAAGVISTKAATLAEGVLKTMLLTKLKIVAAGLVMAGVLGTGVAAVTQQGSAERPAAPPDQVSQARREPQQNQPTAAKKDADSQSLQVNGVVKAVDAPRNTLTISQQDGEATFTVAKDAHIDIDGKPGELAALPKGAHVQLREFVDRQTARSVHANGSSDFGTVKAVDAQRNTITVTGGSPNDRIYNVPSDTPIVIDGKPSTLAAIPKGAHLHALDLRVDQQTTHSINVVGPGFHHVPVKAVDAARNTITIGDKAHPDVAGKTFPVAPDADIRIDGKTGRLTEVTARAFVNLGLSVDSQTARNLLAEGPNLGDCGGSLVKAVDAVRNTITFDDKAAPEMAGKTFTIAPDANIVIDAGPGKLAEVPPGSFVNLLLTVDQQTVRQVNAQGPRVSGLVKAVDAANKTVTIDDKTFPLAKDAVIVIEAQRAPLAGLQIGMSVNVNLHIDQRTVGLIQTQSKVP